MAVKNIEMNYKNENGYDVLYPNITSSSLIGAINLSSQTTGSIDISSRTTGNLPISRVPGVLPLSGGTMSGNLILNGNPSSMNQAANKGYVDGLVNNVNDEIGLKLIDSKEIVVNGYQTDVSSCINIGNEYNTIIGFLLKGNITLSTSQIYCDLMFKGVTDYTDNLNFLHINRTKTVEFLVPFVYGILDFTDNNGYYNYLWQLDNGNAVGRLIVANESYFCATNNEVACTGTLTFYYLGF